MPYKQFYQLSDIFSLLRVDTGLDLKTKQNIEMKTTLLKNAKKFTFSKVKNKIKE